MSRKIDNADTYLHQLEDALNAYDGWQVALLVTGTLSSRECYDTMHKNHGEAIKHAIKNSIARKAK